MDPAFWLGFSLGALIVIALQMLFLIYALNKQVNLSGRYHDDSNGELP